MQLQLTARLRDTLLVSSVFFALAGVGLYHLTRNSRHLTPIVAHSASADVLTVAPDRELAYAPRGAIDETGFRTVLPAIKRWPRAASSMEISS